MCNVVFQNKFKDSVRYRTIINYYGTIHQMKKKKEILKHQSNSKISSMPTPSCNIYISDS